MTDKKDLKAISKGKNTSMMGDALGVLAPAAKAEKGCILQTDTTLEFTTAWTRGTIENVPREGEGVTVPQKKWYFPVPTDILSTR